MSELLLGAIMMYVFRCSSRNGMNELRDSEEFRNNYFKPNMCAGYLWHKKVADIHHKKFITPYLTDSVREFFYNKSWEELNTPSQKHHVRNAFDEFKLIKNVKKHFKKSCL